MTAVLVLVLLAFKLTTQGSCLDTWHEQHNPNGQPLQQNAHQPPAIQATWESDDDSHRLLHLTLDEHTGSKRVYIGAVNRIFQLSSDLKLEAQAIMGPEPDDYECPVTRTCPQHVERKLTNYHNKALIIYTSTGITSPSTSTSIHTTSPQLQSSLYPPNQLPLVDNSGASGQQRFPQHQQQQVSTLISCGTLFQGSCALHNLENVANFRYPANESVVANSPQASTVAFIAPGPIKQLYSRQYNPALYVGTSYTGLGPFNGDIPAVSSRSLQYESMFNVLNSDVASGTRLVLNSLSRDSFPITYVHGFSSKGFSYFLTVQKKSSLSSKPFISKLVRVCQKDINYHSYVEVPLQCRMENGIDYNLAQAAYVGKPGLDLAQSLGVTTSDEVLYVAFSKSSDKRDIYNEPSHQSALCVYSLPAIHHIFIQNIQHCFNGNGNQGLDFITRTERCAPTQVHITDDFCGMDVNNPMSGSIPIDNIPVIEYKNLSITAVAASLINDFTVAYLGTSTGQLKRLVIENSTTAVEYSSVYVDPRRRTPINADIRFDKKDFIYVMNDRRISLIKLQECNSYKSCDDCLQAYDPYCGWCSLENRCSTKGTCAGADSDSLSWLSYKSGKCTTIKSVFPSQIQKTTTRTLSLNIENLPSVEGPFLCGFTVLGKTEFTNASKIRAGTITCTTPMTDSLPALTSQNHDLVTRLSVRMLNGPDFTATNFTFFDCSSYTTCTECVSSPYPCDWCVTGHRCTHDTGENCRNDVLITGVSQKGSSARPGPKFCPRLDPSHGMTEILVSSGLPRRIQVQVKEMPPVITSDKFSCQFNVEGRVRQVNAQLLANIVYCDPMEFTYSRNTPNITASFAVIWGNSKPLDNPQDIHILVYQCSSMADNCGFCLELPEKYSCGWCKESNSCQIQEHCPLQRPSFLVSLDTCPNPQITSFEPMSGPYEGGTSITIHGINLGRSFEDLQVSLELTNNQDLKMGLIECVPIEGSYIRTSQITCQLPNSPITGSYGTILVKIANEFVARSIDRFVFVNPSITSFVPAKGPKSGGTKLTLWGLDMNAGSKAEVNVGSSPCQIIGRSHERADCITGSASGIGEQRVSMKFDNAEKSFIDYNFLYVEDPDIDIVTSPQASYLHSSFVNRIPPPPRGIPAGGIIVHVKGKSFISIQQPRFYVVVDGIKYNGSCQVENATEMNCLSPFVPEDKISLYRSSPEEPVELDYGFFLDNVEEVHNLASRRDSRFPMFLMYSNPEYRPFPEEVKLYKSDYLTINGSNLDRASSEHDIMVRIGKGYCNVTSLSRTQLTCKPPPIQPEALNWIGQSNSNLLPDVVVHVGNSLNFTIGKLSYDSLDGFDGPLPRSVMTFLVFGACFLMLVVVMILIAYRRKASESNRVVKTMQEQMDVLEMKVASEAKQAFTELQTEMTDLTDDLEHGGIPYLDYRIYAMKVLFPNSSDHPVLSEMQVDHKIRAHFEKGLASFDQLIMNKTFLLLFIRTLESNRYFSMRDRVNVASLIMVTLQNRMEYCTDILKTLLADLIERSMESRSHPKLLLRRTESVAEKMLSSWFTFLLYKFLRECAGEPLFLLYQAIKHQVNKGPVDVITSEARCSLSEEKLIRQSVDYKPLIVYVSISPQTAYLSGVDPNLQTDNLEMGVKVLDCDTISQVKEKAIDAIYKSTPYSQRPCKDNLDLEWLATPTARVIMSDEDHTTKTEGYWKRLNTLAHYRVSDGARLVLVTKQTSLYNMSLGGAGSEKHRYETLSHFGKSLVSSPLGRSLSPLNNNGGELMLSDNSGHKYWHLVRHHDNDHRDGERSAKMVSEIYLTRLLATKGTLQRFVDDLFETIFSTARLTSSLPIAIKYMFDFLDDQARGHGITDPEVVHTWKSNSLPLRFWVNLIKNPNFVFDINKSNIVDSCLSVVAQTFMDACSTSEHRLGKDSPSSKLLYAKDLPIYKDWVERYYNEIAMMPPINEQDMNAMLAEETRQHAHEFNTNVSLHELFKYAIKYQEQLMFTLEEDEFAKKFKLAARLRQTMLIMNGDPGDVLLPI